MTVIENFATLSVEEQIKFAKDLIEKLNLEKIFTDETKFIFEDVEPDDVTGGLWILTNSTDSIMISRKATWSAADKEDAEYEDPGRDADYHYSILDDAKKSFKTLATVLDGYNVSLQIEDDNISENEASRAEIEIDKISHEDSGIGSYEFWGQVDYDSHPYLEVTGTITKAYDCPVTIYVEAKDEIEVAPEEV